MKRLLQVLIVITLTLSLATSIARAEAICRDGVPQEACGREYDEWGRDTSEGYQPQDNSYNFPAPTGERSEHYCFSAKGKRWLITRVTGVGNVKVCDRISKLAYRKMRGARMAKTCSGRKVVRCSAPYYLSKVQSVSWLIGNEEYLKRTMLSRAKKAYWCGMYWDRIYVSESIESCLSGYSNKVAWKLDEMCKAIPPSNDMVAPKGPKGHYLCFDEKGRWMFFTSAYGDSTWDVLGYSYETGYVLNQHLVKHITR